MISDTAKKKMHLIALISEAFDIVESRDTEYKSWHEIYDEIFSAHISSAILRLCNDLGIDFDYYDPDADYDDDVLAYIRALEQLAEKILDN